MNSYCPPLIRPPSEADSLILQATYGCSHNRCAFCVTYKERPFGIRPIDEIKAEIDGLSVMLQGVKRVFLGDGDPMVLSSKKLAPILEHIQRRLPSVRRVTAYGSPKNFTKKTVQELRELHDLGLTQIYMGFESGDDEVLGRIDKGVTADDIARACDKIHDAGMKISAIVILGLGGSALSMRHAEASAALVNRTKPRFLSALTLMLPPLEPCFQDVFEDPQWRELMPVEILRECHRLIDGIDGNGIIFRANHVSNYIALSGTLQKSKQRLLEEIEAACEQPPRQRIRLGF